MENPALFVRVSRPDGHHTVPAVTAEAAGWEVLDKESAVDSHGRPLPFKPRENKLSSHRAPVDDNDSNDGFDGPPAKSAKREFWDAYAFQVGLTIDEIASLTTKTELIDAALAAATPTDSETDVSDDLEENA